MLRCLNQYIIHAFIQSDCLMNIYHVQESVLGTVKTIARKRAKFLFFHDDRQNMCTINNTINK